MAIKFDREGVYGNLRRGLGRSIEDAIPVALGGEDDDGNQLLRVPSTETDAPNMYYFHEMPQMAEFRGWAVNSGPTALQAKYLKWGQPVYIKRDVNTGIWVIHGLVPDFGSEFIEGTNTVAPEPVSLGQLTSGLLDETDPPSMRARVMATWYDNDYVETQNTADWSSSPDDVLSNPIDIPTTNGKALYVLVQIDATTGTLSYKQGAEIDSLLTHAQAYAIDVDGSVIPRPDTDLFRCGYVKLVSGMTRVTRQANLWQVQEIITKGGGGGSGAFSGVRAELTEDWDVPDSTDDIIVWDTESFDTDAYHDNVTNPSRLTAPANGFYRIGWKLIFSGGATWSNDLLINGSLNETVIPNTSSNPVIWLTKQLTAGQYAQLQVWQNSGSEQQIQVGSWFAMEFIGT